jgi:hypothetical protein
MASALNFIVAGSPCMLREGLKAHLGAKIPNYEEVRRLKVPNLVVLIKSYQLM